MSKKPKVANLEMTCNACPAQWEGETKDGLYVYIRYRYGLLSARVGGERIYIEPHGDSLSGVMSTDEMKRNLRKVLKFP